MLILIYYDLWLNMNTIKNSPVHNSDPGENRGLTILLRRAGTEEWGRLQHTVHGGVVADKRYK